MDILFINASPNKSGNTVALAQALLAGRDYREMDLVDYKVYGYGQKFADDQFDEVVEAMRESDVIVVGSPVYWHNLSGMLRNVLDRCYGSLDRGELSGKSLFFLFQGAAPSEEMLAWGEYTMSRFAGLYGMDYRGMASSRSQAKKLSESLSRI
jgi:multimeric flavodoxin WrbA